MDQSDEVVSVAVVLAKLDWADYFTCSVNFLGQLMYRCANRWP